MTNRPKRAKGRFGKIIFSLICMTLPPPFDTMSKYELIFVLRYLPLARQVSCENVHKILYLFNIFSFYAATPPPPPSPRKKRKRKEGQSEIWPQLMLSSIYLVKSINPNICVFQFLAYLDRIPKVSFFYRPFEAMRNRSDFGINCWLQVRREGNISLQVS